MIATGFLRSYAKVGYREKDNPQFRYEYLDDMIGTIGRGVLGLTVQLRALPQPQVRPDLAERLLPDAGVAVRLRGDGLSAGVEGAGRGVREEDGGDRCEDRAAAAAGFGSSTSLIATRLAQEKYKKYPANVQHAIAIPEDEADAGRSAAGRTGDSHARRFRREVDRSRDDARRTWREESALNEQIAALEKERPKPLPMAADRHRRRLPVHARRSGRRAGAGQGRQARGAVEGSFLFKGRGAIRRRRRTS